MNGRKTPSESPRPRTSTKTKGSPGAAKYAAWACNTSELYGVIAQRQGPGSGWSLGRYTVALRDRPSRSAILTPKFKVIFRDSSMCCLTRCLAVGMPSRRRSLAGQELLWMRTLEVRARRCDVAPNCPTGLPQLPATQKIAGAQGQQGVPERLISHEPV